MTRDDDEYLALERFVDQPGQWINTTPPSVRRQQEKGWEELSRLLAQGSISSDAISPNKKNSSAYEETQFLEMSEDNYTRPAQIPIRQDRFSYLLDYSCSKESNTWILFQHPGHFRIYSRKSKHCVFDATYMPLEKTGKKLQENPIVAVITEIKINRDQTQCPIRLDDDFKLFSNLILHDL